MSLVEISSYAISTILILVLSWAAISDIRHRRIPNRSVLMVIGLFAAWSLTTGMEATLSGLYASLIALGVCFTLYFFNIIGAGDAKLFAAVALFAGLTYLPVLALATAFAGAGVLAVGLVLNPSKMFLLLAMRGKADVGRGVPYGVAIAGGATFVQLGRILHHF